MRILILGAGKMGAFFTDLLSFDHDVAVLETDAKRLRFIYNALRYTTYAEIQAFHPELIINCVTLSKTIEAFEQCFPYIDKTCVLSDIASVKTELKAFYQNSGFRYVSVHPMFGPTFANLGNLQSENAIIINEPASFGDTKKSSSFAQTQEMQGRTDPEGLNFYRKLFQSLKLHVCEYTFDEHDETVAYSLSIPFASTLVFGGIMKRQDAPGTTFKKHLAIAHGLLSEDDYLLTEILFNPHTEQQLEQIILQLTELKSIVHEKDTRKMKLFLDHVRNNLQ